MRNLLVVAIGLAFAGSVFAQEGAGAPPAPPAGAAAPAAPAKEMPAKKEAGKKKAHGKHKKEEGK